MPITKSAKKALRQTRSRTARNSQRKEAYRKAVKMVRKLLAAKKIGEAETFIPQAYKALDKAAKTGVIKKNAAARKKSQLMAWIKRAGAAAK